MELATTYRVCLAGAATEAGMLYPVAIAVLKGRDVAPESNGRASQRNDEPEYISNEDLIALAKTCQPPSRWAELESDDCF